jgi:sugar lactone lactonase YvrE
LAGTAFLTAGALALFTLDGAASAAVVLDGVALDSGDSELVSPYAVAVDPIGNMYAVDQYKHRITKFNSNGFPKRIFGNYGFGDGQLYYPEGIAVGTHNSGDLLVYVADTANSRITVFDDGGRFVDTFGEFGSGDGQLNYPSGIAFIKFSFGSGGNVLVADTRNNRVSVFTDAGTFLRNLPCSTCPFGSIRPLGVAVRRVGANGNLQIYAVDELTKIVQVMNQNGVWQRSIGEKGTGEGQLQAPDDVAVDEDGNVFVADTGFAGGSTERITKYGSDGKFL